MTNKDVNYEPNKSEKNSPFNLKTLLILLIFLLIVFVAWRSCQTNKSSQDKIIVEDAIEFEEVKEEEKQAKNTNKKEDSLTKIKKELVKPKKGNNLKKEKVKIKVSPKKSKSPITNSKKKSLLPKIEMIKVQGGSFQMGSNKGNRDEKPIHLVTLPDFQIGKYEVNQKLWEAVVGTNPSHFKGDNLPVEQVNWNDVQKFLKKLNELTGKKYRLPTEAEWEYAARGGNKKRRYKFSGSNRMANVAWNTNNSDSKTQNVGTKSPNQLGIYDMSGNVWEWCQDKWVNNYKDTPDNGTAWLSDKSLKYVFRGGSWFSYGTDCRTTNRGKNNAKYRMNYLGFRMVLTP